MRTFLVIWAGQTVSLLGSGLTSFALGVWVLEKTGSVTDFSLILFFMAAPAVVVSPFAGSLVDRWDRRWTLIGSDVAAAVASLGILALLSAGSLELWHIYALVGFSAIFNTFQWPAFTASTTLLVDPKHYSRAAAMSQMGLAASQVVGPALGGVLLVTVGLRWVILIDFATFLVGVATLLAVRIPKPPPEDSDDGDAPARTLLADFRYGWRYLRARGGLLGLLALFAVVNFSIGMLNALLPPLVLSFTNPTVLGSVLSVAGVGMVIGTVVMSVWAGPKRRMSGIFWAILLQGAICFLGSFRPNVWLVGSAAFFFLLVSPVVTSCSQAIWQSKVPPALQGRVFALRRMVAMSAMPVAFAIAGPLADRVFEPMMAPGGLLAPTVGQVLGTGEGRGVALLFVLLGVLILTSLALAVSSRKTRHVETELPDAVRPGEETGETEKPSESWRNRSSKTFNPGPPEPGPPRPKRR